MNALSRVLKDKRAIFSAAAHARAADDVHGLRPSARLPCSQTHDAP
ncbi:MAG TPA: hypothetical protein VGJ30_11035 [Candidatus Angelobacter sp.]